MNADLGKDNFTDAELQALRAKVQEIKNAEDLSWSQLATESGIAKSTISAFGEGSYSGNNNKVANEVQRWLNAREEQRKERARLPDIPAFLETPTAERITNLLRWAQTAQDLVVIAGAPGIGKTATAIQYSAITPRCWHAAMAPSTRGVNTALVEILDAMGEHDAKGTPQALSRRVAHRVKDSGALIIIDESQHLSEQAIEELRAIHDRTGVGIVFMGNEEIYSRINGTGRKAAFAQVTSRVGMRLNQPRAKEGDTRIIAEAWGVAAKSDAMAFLIQIARKPGGLRGVTKTLRLATMLANGEGDTRSLGHLKEAWSQLSAEAVA